VRTKPLALKFCNRRRASASSAHGPIFEVVEICLEFWMTVALQQRDELGWRWRQPYLERRLAETLRDLGP